MDEFYFPDFCYRVVVVPLSFFSSGSSIPFGLDVSLERSSVKTAYLYEDRWWSANELVRARISAHLGLGEREFARNSRVRLISSQEAASFLDCCHDYGNAKAKYRYGLYLSGREDLIAVATFSAFRPMDRAAVRVKSYEWVRYASLPGLRVVGGMGKMMSAFVQEVSPDEIMSYSDTEWSDGDVYSKLGFELVGQKKPISFLVDVKTMKRISQRKLSRDRIYRNNFEAKEYCNGLIPVGNIRICNLGSRKYLWSK